MKEFWTSISNILSGENGPLYVALLAITSVTLGWRFLGNNYSAEWDGGKIYPAGPSPADNSAQPVEDSGASPVMEDNPPE